MTQTEARQKLVRFLEEKAFRPVVQADPADYPESQREKLKDVQRRTEQEIERFRNYASAKEVVTNFKHDLNSEPAKKVHRALNDLDLPTLNDVQTEFEKLAGDLGLE